MFISVLDLFKTGIGPSSSHTLGPMIAAREFIQSLKALDFAGELELRCMLKGSLAFTGKGHATDRAIILGLHGYQPDDLLTTDINQLIEKIASDASITTAKLCIQFSAEDDIIFDKNEALPQHPNGMIFKIINNQQQTIRQQIYFSIGGGFICTDKEINQIQAPLKMEPSDTCPYPFDSANSMLAMAAESQHSIAYMKLANELEYLSEPELNQGIDKIWQAMTTCIETGLKTDGILPGGLQIKRRAKKLFQQIKTEAAATINDWLCAYAMAVNEENAAGHMVVTAPTNGAAGVIPAVLYYYVQHENGTIEQVRNFLLTASAIGGLIKHRSSISGAEVGCQGEVGSAAAMAAAGLCAAKNGTPAQIENAAEIALEHHLGMTCDPVNGLVQVPCIERNGFGAIKAYTAASLALHGSGKHFMPLDNCIEAMKQTGLEMSTKYKETSLGGLAVSLTEC